MAYSVGIFRRPPRRQLERSIRQKFVVLSVVSAPPADVQAPVFPHRQFKIPEPIFQRQQRTQIPLGVAAAPPVVRPPGFLEIIAARTARYPKLLARERFDYKAAQKVYHGSPFGKLPGLERRTIHRRPSQLRRARSTRDPRRKFVSTLFVPPPVVPAPGWNRRRVTRQHRKPRFKFRRLIWISKKVLPPGIGADIGWLVSWVIKRVHGHNLRR